ncbi:MAG: hypothetical protein LUQ50_00630 [Methanospirillum sp.]|uniref:hypothetical protein n=1 Tax=Methanospirillum sp. TaxID=45200 RepID=UPI00236D88BA|nr:hypothetical protein [Methanospirillum sp.]MDD1727557.1 hypothetical protein [Methanospirillum sp.]
MGVRIKDLPSLHSMQTSAVIIDNEGNIRVNGVIPRTRSEALILIINQLKKDLAEWDHADVGTLFSILSDIETVVFPQRLHEAIDLSTLPSEPIPDSMKPYPIWALDKTGYCLAGAGQVTIEPLVKIHQWFVTRKPGYCSKPTVSACYLCSMTRSGKDCRSNHVFYPDEY